MEFRQDREVYERRISEKNADPNVQVPLTTYKDSIDVAVLQVFAIGNWVPVDTVSEMTEEHLRSCIQSHAVVAPKDYDLALLEEELKSVKMDLPSSDKPLKACVWEFVLKYTQLLNSLEYEKFIKEHPKLAVEHVLTRLSSDHLKKRMLITAKLLKEEDFRKNFNAFVRKMSSEAGLMDSMHASKRYKPSSSGLDSIAVPLGDVPPIGSSVSPLPRGHELRGRKKKDGGNRINRSGPIGSPSRGSRRRKDGADRSGQKRKWPKCLNPVCHERHFIDDCPRTSDAEGRRLKDQYHANKKARSDEGIDRKQGKFVGSIETSGESQDNTSMFSASFCNGAVEVTVLADQGSDGNLISPSVLKVITESDPNVLIKQLPSPVHFSSAHTAAQKITCSKEITADVLLRIRHGNNLLLRA